MKEKTTDHTDKPETWQTRYEAKEESWNDLARIRMLIVPPALLLTGVLLYSVLYIDFDLQTKGGVIDSSWTMLKMLVILITPIIMTMFGLRNIFRNSDRWLREFYRLTDEIKSSHIIRRRLIGVIPLPPPLGNFWKYPSIVIEEPRLKEKDEWARWLGGPANLIVYDGIALYLERGNRFSRVVGPGLPLAFLERHERIRSIVDLRPQTLAFKVENYSKDGIKVCMELSLVCQIKHSEESLGQSRNLVYAFDPVQVQKAVERTTVKRDPETGGLYESEWLDGLVGRVNGKFSGYITGHRIDELFVALNELESDQIGIYQEHITGQGEQMQILSPATAHNFMDDLNNHLLKDDGCGVLSIQILSIQVPEDVTNERLSYWQAERQKLARMRAGRSDADQLRIKEMADTDAQRDIFQTIAKSLEKVNATDYTNSLLVSFASILNQNIEDPFSRAYFALESPDLLKKLQKLLADEPAPPKGE